MDTVTKRQQSIITMLNGTDGWITGASLASGIGVSIRTIQNDIRSINATLGNCITSSEHGYKYTKAEDRAGISDDAVVDEDKGYNQLKTKLFIAQAPFDIFDLADSLFISSSTLNRWLRQLKNELSQYESVRLVREHDQVYLEGSEYQRRSLIRDILFHEVGREKGKLEEMFSEFTSLDLNHIESIIHTTVKKFNYYVEEPYTTNIVVSLLIAISRSGSDAHDLVTPDRVLHSKIEYQIAKEICTRIQEHWRVTLDDAGIEYIAYLINGQIKPDRMTTSNLVQGDEARKIRQIINDTFDYYLLRVDISSVIGPFLTHISALLDRSRRKQNVVAGYVAEGISETSPFTYEIAVYLAQHLEEAFKVNIPSDEIALLGIYIGSILNEANRTSLRVRVGVICPQYKMLSDRFEEGIRNKFGRQIDIRFVKPTLPERALIRQTDIIISTEKINNPEINYVLVSPFLDESDQVKITKALGLISDKVQQDRLRRSIFQYFSPKLFFKNPGVSTKAEAIELLANSLVSANICDSDYVASVFRRESLSSTSFFNLFAVPHAIEMNAKRTMISVLIESRGIQWDDDVRIRCVLMVAVSRQDRKQFMKLYSGIVQTLCDATEMEKMIKAKNFDEFVRHFV